MRFERSYFWSTYEEPKARCPGKLNPFRSEHIIISETYKVYNVSAARVQQTVTIYALAGGNT